jgi:gamma-glutamyltranspeptidase/glutathione hydrolase
VLGLLACTAQLPEAPPEAAKSVRTVAALQPADSQAAGRSARVPVGWRFDLQAAPTRAQHYLVDSDSSLASQAGVDILVAGGNAIDAAVTIAFVLAVVYPEAGNLGGGGFAVVRARDGSRAALDFRETAPLAAEREMFLDAQGAPQRLGAQPGSPGPGPDASKAGHRAAGVPGSVAGLWALHQRFGSRPWKDLLAPAIRFAEQGILVDAEFARSSSEALPRLARFAASRALFLKDDQPLASGETFRNPDLARVLRRIAREGRADFYTGATAQLLLREMRRGGGLILDRDLASYEARWREPIEFSYRGHTIVSMPPPSSGGVALALIARTLEAYPLTQIGWHSTQHIHLLSEAMSRAFADRNSLLGDPDQVNVPIAALLSPAYADVRRSDIGERATPSARVRPGLPAPEGTHTTHFGVVDAYGGAVALTTTINDLYGSGVTVAGAGFLLNDEMDDFTIKPGAPNLFGLVQGEANAIAPNKRMLSSMAPTLVLDPGDRVRIVAGARGGPRIISSTWQVISNVIDFDMTVTEAVSAPRVHHQWQPDEVAIERTGLPEATERALEGLGHRLHVVPEIGNAPAILREPDNRGWTGIADPRRGGAALGG